MATGWAKDGAVQEQIDASIEDALADVRARLPAGESRRHCEECGEEIPPAREAVPGVRLCIVCQEEADKRAGQAPRLYNRRGSKDSQLR